ncbi:MAG: hypothetical protein QOE58_1046 [Actinomycetota bacterium]|nr:hypothetical protein [Actinomycetota bacterium]
MRQGGRAVASLALLVLASGAAPSEHDGWGETNAQWSGYVSQGRHFTDVSTSFTVPSVSCPEPNMNASWWVGLDGFRNATVEQIGIEALCRDGVPRFSAWWQAYPAPSQPLELPIAPGHRITARVLVGPAGVRFELRDDTARAAFRKTVRVPGAEFTSAEVIAEQSGASQGPLTAFGEMEFDHAMVDGEVLGRTDPLVIVMTDASGSPRVAVGPLGADGDAFTVKWLAA